jgi:hypothetical protein
MQHRTIIVIVNRINSPWEEISLHLDTLSRFRATKSLPLHNKSLPLHNKSLPLHNKSLPLHNKSLPLHNKSLPNNGDCGKVTNTNSSLWCYQRGIPTHDLTYRKRAR